MINHQIHKLNRFFIIQKFLADNSSTFSGFTRLADEIITYNSILDKIGKAATRQKRDNKGIATGKKAARKTMAQTIVRFAAKAHVWAIDTSNANLVSIFSISERVLLNGPAEIALAKAGTIAKAISDNIASLAPYNILPPQTITINNSITAFKMHAAQPAAARSSVKSATQTLSELFPQADTSLLLITNLLRGQYSSSHPTLVSQFIHAHRIGKIPVRHTGITATITLDSKNFEGAQLGITELNKQSTSDINGITPLLRCRTGTYHIQISAPGCTTITTKQKINRGHILELKIEMEKVN